MLPRCVRPEPRHQRPCRIAGITSLGRVGHLDRVVVRPREQLPRHDQSGRAPLLPKVHVGLRRPVGQAPVRCRREICEHHMAGRRRRPHDA